MTETNLPSPPPADNPHCAGCGTAAGQPRVTWKNKLVYIQGERHNSRVPVYSAPVKLQPVAFLDYGVRAFCQFCLDGALRETGRVTSQLRLHVDDDKRLGLAPDSPEAAAVT